MATTPRRPKFDWNGQKVLVTGAGGFIASHLAERLLELGATVWAFAHYNSRNDPGFLRELKNGDSRLKVSFGDICDLEAVRDASRGADVIFHLAALVGIPYSYHHVHQVVEVNTIGTLNVLTAARENQVKRMVHTSTSEVYGTAKNVPIDENHPKQPQSPYSASKIAADALAMTHHLSFGLPVTICRPFNTYGPRQSDRAVIPALIAQALHRKEIVVGNLQPTRDFTYVCDTVDGFVKVAESDACVGEEINLGTGHEVSIGDLVKKIIDLVGRDVAIAHSEERMRPPASEVQRLCSNNAKARCLAGWSPTVSLEAGLRSTLDWVKNSSHLYDPDRYRT
ncbi:MAG: SDR family NAD(P)-dependent oxidoreductase [Acidobacteria bacterium]|nr:SDR family NAD(P)-dependent oxidoreductase [Acidobacteriota bacterium]MCI0719223.1 SDR family NAD(P)-dependent oxidoreductase [Acidobacteriota bacterium]